jgi:hypothetical protein
MLYETRFLLSLIVTWAIECPVLLLLVRLVFRRKEIPVIAIVLTGMLCTALTLPYLWFVLPPFLDAAYYPLIGETLVVLAEALVLNRLLGLDGKRSLICSLAMNSASFVFGWYLL